MKHILTLFLVLFYVQTFVHGKDIPVAAGGSIATAVNQAVAGDRVVLAAGTWVNVPRFDLKPGVSLVGSGRDKTILKFNTFNPSWIGSINLLSEDVTVGNQVICSLTIDGTNGAAWEGIQIRNRTNIKIYDFNAVGFFHTAVEVIGGLGKSASDIEIYDFNIENCSRETTAGSQGNIALNGYLRRIFVYNGKIIHTSNDKIGPWDDKRSGYAIKVAVVWSSQGTSDGGVFEDSEIHHIDEIGKSFAPWGPTVPNISFEFWGTKCKNVKIYKCNLSTHLSCEYPYNTNGQTSFEIFDNIIKVATGQSIELAVPNAKVYNNTFDYSENTNAWNVIGNYNLTSIPMDGQQITGNKIILDGKSPALYVSYNKLQNFKFENNTVEGTGKPILLNLRNANSAGSNNIYYTNNSYQSGYNEIAFTEGAPATRPANFVVTTGTVTPTPQPSTGTGKTTIISRWREYKAASVRDSAGKMIITIPYEVKEKTEYK